MTRAGLSPRRLAEVGADLADEVGFDQVTASAVARAVGVQVASLYAHVRGYDELRARISLLALEELAVRGDRALAGLAGRDALVALADAHRDYAHEHPGRWTAAGRLRLGDLPPDGDLGVGVRHVEQARAVLRGYAVPETDVPHAVRLLGSTLRGFVDLELGGGFAHSDPPAEASWPRVLDALDASLRHWPA